MVGITGWYTAWKFVSNDVNFPYSVRIGLFGTAYGATTAFSTDGAANKDNTFRPVILN